MRLDPPGRAGLGVEFEIDEDGVTWVEQVKGLRGEPGRWCVLSGRASSIRSRRTSRPARVFGLLRQQRPPQLDDLSARARAMPTQPDTSGATRRSRLSRHHRHLPHRRVKPRRGRSVALGINIHLTALLIVDFRNRRPGSASACVDQSTEPVATASFGHTTNGRRRVEYSTLQARLRASREGYSRRSRSQTVDSGQRP